ncbi:MAG: hypothetical protein ACRD2A_07615 [Vicinamibacterales bacterium]
MRIRRSWLVLVVLLVAPAGVRADDHRMDFWASPSFKRGSNLFGVHGAITLTALSPTVGSLPPEIARRNFSLVPLDFSMHFGDDDQDNDERHITFMGGVRYTFTWREHQGGMPYMQILAGGIHTKMNDLGDLEPALAIGAGWDNIFGRSPTSEGKWGVRLQGDYIVHGGQISPRLSAGVVWRIYNPATSKP